MSDEWKISQGLKAKNLGLGQKNIEAAENLEAKLMSINRIKEEEKRRPHPFRFGTDIKEYIRNCKENNDPISFKYGSIVFEIDDDKPSSIKFETIEERSAVLDNGSRENFTAFIENGEIVYSELEKKEKNLDAHYMEEDKMSVPVEISKTVYVIDGEEINEYYEIFEQPESPVTDDEKENIIHAYLQNNPEYSKGNDNEIIRENIDENEKNKHLVWREKIFRQYLVPGSQSKLANFPSGFYENYIDYRKNVYGKEQFEEYKEYKELAQSFERKCKDIYESIKETYIEMGEGYKFPADEKEQVNDDNYSSDISNIQSIENNSNQENNNIKKDDIEKLSDEELDRFIEAEDQKQKEKQQKIERLRKIKKAKELIALSKQQDKEIAELESQIQKEGMEFDE